MFKEANTSGAFVSRDQRLGMVDQLPFSQCLARLQNRDGMYLLPPVFVGSADHSAFGVSGVQVHGLLGLRRIDALTPTR